MSARGPRFLIVRLGSLGDVIHGIPIAAALRARHPEGRIDWMVHPRYVELLAMVQGVDRKVAIDPRANRAATWELLTELRRRRYYATIDLQGLLKSAVLARLAAPSKRIGFVRAHLREPAARFFYNVRVDPGNARHVIHKNLALLEPLGIRTDRIDFPLTLRRTPVLGLVEAQVGSSYAVVNVGAAWPNKQWPADRFGRLAALLREQLGLSVLVVWGPGEEPLAAQAVAASAGAAVLAPPTTLTDVFAIMAGARLVVSGDTGPLHIAAAVGAPTVSLFGPTDPARNGSWWPEDISLSRYERCDCRYERQCRRAGAAPGTPCIDEIPVDEVMRAAAHRLSIR